MPAIITHHIFGEKAAQILPKGILETEEETLAFILGNQGPDPLFVRFSTSLAQGKVCRSLAHVMHDEKPAEALFNMHSCVSHLAQTDKRVGRAFALGSLGHWLLDSMAHPFIYAQQYAIQASDDGLSASGSEVHALIESDIDSWLLWQIRNKTVEDCPPADELARTDHINQVAGALYAQLALEVFGMSLSPSDYGGAVRDFESMYRLIEPAGSSENRTLGAIERLFRTNSRIEAQAHRITRSDECSSANLERRPWTDPWTGATRTESFADIFVDAVERWSSAAEVFVRGNRDELFAFVGNINYNGKLCS